MTIRADLAAAVNALEGMTVDEWPRQITAVGRGFVSLQRAERDDTGLGYMDRWAVTIVVPQDLTAAEQWIEAHRDELVAALEPVMVVTLLQPIELVLDEGTANAVSIEGSRAH